MTIPLCPLPSPSQDGQLQKGDQILSVDGQQIVGYPYEKAKHLLQQAKARGSVTLIVASCSLKQDGGMKGGGDQGDVVVLRKKKRGELYHKVYRPSCSLVLATHIHCKERARAPLTLL